MAELKVRTADGAERSVALAGAIVTVGRADDCTLVVAEKKASRRHCRFEPYSGGWRVVDEGSSNGTWLLGRPVLNARLRSGDEVEIGDTVLTFLDGPPVAPPIPREQRRPKPRAQPAPWGLLAVPVIAGAIAYGVVAALADGSRQETASHYAAYADAEIARSALRKTPAEAAAALRSAREAIAGRAQADAAVAAIDAAVAKLGDAGEGPTPGRPHSTEWRDALQALDADASLSASQRRAALATLLERHFADDDAVRAIRERLRAELASAGERSRAERERAFAEGDRAMDEGRFGDALAAWQRWIGSVAAVTEEHDRALAVRFADAVGRSRTAAEQAAAQADAARKQGRPADAQAILDDAAAKLAGTGFDVWLAARGATGRVARIPGAKPDSADAAAERERAAAMQIAAAAEQIVRRRRFSEAAARMDQAVAAVSDAAMKGDLAARAADLRTEQAYLERLFGLVAAEPQKFSPVKLGEKGFRVVAATPEEVTLAYGNAAPEPHPVADLDPAVFAQFVEKAAPAADDLVPAALLLHDVGEEEGYLKWMRAALSNEQVRLANSLVHARVSGIECPPDGFLPHPRDGRSIVTRREHDRILNAEKIAARTVDLAKEVEKLEKTKQAKAVETVRKAYQKLEAARTAARTLIFDEVRYFYPYRTRPAEYAPVQKEVNDLVKAVEEAWEDGTKATIRSDTAFDKLRAGCDSIVVDIQYLGGEPPEDLVKRIAAVTRYLPGGGSTSAGRELTVQTFYETDADLALLEYNAKVLKYNPTVKGPTEPERKQVEITNQYRIMFGHLRALRIHPALVLSARGHSEDMSKLGFFDHTNPHDPAKRNPDDRVKLAGYPMSGCSENIQQGTGDPLSAHQGWCHSSGHHRNILTPAWVEMGSGVSGAYFTQNFGFRTDDDWEGGVPK